MKLLDQRAKKEMEECKRRARDAGLVFADNTIEYSTSNRDMIELSPKNMIPTLYDYWADDVEVIRGKWLYDAFPHNPYETVINTRPPISFYNTDNTDWFNVMIFYHVIGHIDFFQNNDFFRKTWGDDFSGQALADKRLIGRIREEMGAEKRWVDYVIEFARAIDNLVGYYPELEEFDQTESSAIFGTISQKLNFYFGQFLKERREARVVEMKFYYDEVERYNLCLEGRDSKKGEIAFFQDSGFQSKFPEFNSLFKKWQKKERKHKPKDIFEHLMMHSEFLNKEENDWMSDVIGVIRRTSLYFQPQIRSKISNEGWASLWHQRLFIPDERIETHEIDYARVDSGVTTDPRMGINPYAVGMHLLEFIEELARKGRLSPQYQLLKDLEAREHFDQKLGAAYGKKVLFEARKSVNDYLLINFLSDEDFQDFVNKYNLFVLGVRPSNEKWDKAEVYIKSKSGTEYRRLLNNTLYHPPHISINEDKAKDGELYLDHTYEGRTLMQAHIQSVLVGLEFFWGKRVRLETTEYEQITEARQWWDYYRQNVNPKHRKVRVLYTCENKRVERTVISPITDNTVYDG